MGFIMRGALILLCCVIVIHPRKVFSFVPNHSIHKSWLKILPSKNTNNLDGEPPTERASLAPFAFNKSSSGFQNFADKLFEKADVNKDGSLDFNETYEMVLKLYVKLNRKAPIPPPSREQVLKIFKTTDENADHTISRQEFNRLARILGRRALTRLVAHRVVTLTFSPLLAALVVRKLRGRAWLYKTAEAIVPERFLPVLCSASFWRTALVVVFVASLGNIVINCVNFVFDYGDEAANKQTRE